MDVCTYIYIQLKYNHILKLVCNMPINLSLNLSLLHLTTVTFQKYFWMAVLLGLYIYLLEFQLREIFGDTLYQNSGGLQALKTKSLLISSILILDFKVYVIFPEGSITAVYILAGLVSLMDKNTPGSWSDEGIQ